MNPMSSVHSPLKPKGHHIDNLFITGPTWGCQNGNLGWCFGKKGESSVFSPFPLLPPWQFLCLLTLEPVVICLGMFIFTWIMHNMAVLGLMYYRICTNVKYTGKDRSLLVVNMMASSHGHIFHITCHLCGGFPAQRASNAELWWSLCCKPG